MWGPPEFLRSAAVIVVVAGIAFVLTHTGSHFEPQVVEVHLPDNPAADDLLVELRRCRALGPQDTVDARCFAVWEENRRRFFGAPAKPLPSASAGSVAAPAASTHALSMPGAAR